MAVNDKIKVADYNTIRTKVVNVLGPGAGNTGYGQNIKSSAVTVASKVGVNDWAKLYYDIYNAYMHQTGAAPPSPGTIAEFEKIKYSATKPNYQYDTYANTLVANRFTVGPAQSSTMAKGTVSQFWGPGGTYGTSWNSLAQCTVTVTFSTAAQARYFFNSGGQIRFTSTRSGGSTSGQNTSWTNLLNAVNLLNGSTGPQFGGANPETGTDPNNGQNYYKLSSTPYSWYSASASSPYGSNFFRIYASSPNVADNSGGTDREVRFIINWADGYVDPGVVPGYIAFPQGTVPTGQGGAAGMGSAGGGVQTSTAADFPPDDKVDGTLTLSVSTLFATGILIPAGSPAFAVEDPTITIGAITS